MDKPEAGGLFANGARVPLKGVSIEAKARSFAAEVLVAQRYRNEETVPVEAVYSFPLPEGAAVCGFEVLVGEKRIVGQVSEREAAFERYDEAMAKGHGAYLADQDRPNIFTASIGNLLPGQEAVVRLSYATELEVSGKSIRLLIPTTLSPRYIPPKMAATMDPSERDRIAPPTVVGGVPYGLRLSVEIDAGADVRAVECPSHPARVSVEGRTARVELAGEDVQLDQDFVLLVELAEPHRASAVVAREEDGTRVAMLSLFPDLAGLRRTPKDVVFLVDRSGSMEGESIDQARKALLLCLRSLEEGDRFNIIGFGHGLENYEPAGAAYSQSALDEASRYVQGIGADMGGTELHPALLAALEGTPVAAGLQRMVILLTDGEVGNEQECIDLAARHAGRIPVFTFGIGRGASEHLVRGIARASRGQAELIHPGERIEPKVLRQFARLSAGRLENVRLDLGALKADLVAPAELPPLFPGDRLAVYARLAGGVSGEVAVLADAPEGTVRFPVRVDLEGAADLRAIPVLMARKAIQDLEEGRGGAAKGSAQRGRREKATKARILALALRYRILSSETSLVAVEERPAGSQAQPAELRRIPVALTKGWGGIGAGGTVFKGSMPQICGMAPPDMGMGAESDGMLCKSVSPPPSANTRRRSAAAPRRKKGVLAKIADAFGAGGAPPADDFLALALCQGADGGFDLTPALVALARLPRETLEAVAERLGLAPEKARRIVATLLALRMLEERFGSRRDEWRLLAGKAERWLERQKAPVPAGASDLGAWLRASLEA